MGIKTCPYCGSDRIVTGIKIKMNAEVNDIGLTYRVGFLGAFRGVEPIYTDLCEECGSITRLWVKNTENKWDLE